MTTINCKEHITADPAISAGKPAVKGTRLSVEFILGLLAEGWDEKKSSKTTRSSAWWICRRFLLSPRLAWKMRNSWR